MHLHDLGHVHPTIVMILFYVEFQHARSFELLLAKLANDFPFDMFRFDVTKDILSIDRTVAAGSAPMLALVVARVKLHDGCKNKTGNQVQLPCQLPVYSESDWST